MKTIYVIEEIDQDQGHCVIGVSDTVENAESMIKEFFGELEILKAQSIEENGIEFIWDVKFEGEVSQVVVRYFELNEI